MAKLAFGENTGNAARLGLVTEQPWLQLDSFRVFVIKLWALVKNWSPMYAFKNWQSALFLDLKVCHSELVKTLCKGEITVVYCTTNFYKCFLRNFLCFSWYPSS